MKRTTLLGITAALILWAGAAVAGERTVTLAVDNMVCATCPYIVKKSISAVPGVSRVEVSYETRTAVVTFDDAKTGVDAIAAASAGAGFPARPVNTGG